MSEVSITPTMWDNELKHGDRTKLKWMAEAYVKENYPRLKVLEQYTRDELINFITSYRNEGREEERIITDMWLMANYAPEKVFGSMNIGGGAAVKLAEDILKEARNG